jgi:hypothetical protein
MEPRTSEETAKALSDIYDENFAQDCFSQYRINWPELRSLAGVTKLTEEYLHDVNVSLTEAGYTLIPLDNFLVVAAESDFTGIRYVSAKMIEQYMPGDDNNCDDDLDDIDMSGSEEEE